MNMQKFFTYISRIIYQLEGDIRLEMFEVIFGDDIIEMVKDLELVIMLEEILYNWEVIILLVLEVQLKKIF